MVRRREVLQGLSGLGAAWLAAPLDAARGTGPNPGDPRRFQFDPPPFALGVASGDPTSTSVILWTRLAAQPLDVAGLGGLEAVTYYQVEWAVAVDPQMREVVRSGTLRARREGGYAVRAQVDGLAPGMTYYYRFALDSRTSRIGRTRTCAVAPGGLRFACVSCQDFNAFYGAFASLANEDLDFVVHLGDTIYEASLGVLASGLAGYRNKHALFRGDPLARAAWAAHPFFVTWDDHEVWNNYAGTDPAFGELRDTGYQAFFENMPVRWPAPMPSRWRDLRIYRSARFGDLLELDLLDVRQYRDLHPADAHAALAPGRTMLGQKQKRWLHRRLRSDARWICLGSPVFMSEYRGNPDAWDGYARERWQLLRAVAENAPGRTVVLSGDWHRSIASRVPMPADGPRFRAAEASVAVEFGAPPISSKTPQAESTDPDAGFTPKAEAPWVLYEDLGYHGYLICDVTADRWRTEYRAWRSGPSPCTTRLAAFEVLPGVAGADVTFSGFVPFAC